MKLRSIRALLPLLFAPLLLAAAACSSAPRLHAPRGFAELDSTEDYAYRATNASGVVVAVRSEPNDPKGNLDFWTSAIDLQLKKSGFTSTAEAAEPVTTSRGLAGRRLRYRVDRGGRPHDYWVTVFVTDRRVVVIEAAGDQAFFDGATQKSVDAAVRSVEL